MAIQYLWYASGGPMMYDDTDTYPQDDVNPMHGGPALPSGVKYREGAWLTGQAYVDGICTEDTHVVRRKDLEWALPVGSIIMWSGSAAALAALTPKWQLCDGTNGTPDLRGRMVICEGTTTGV